MLSMLQPEQIHDLQFFQAGNLFESQYRIPPAWSAALKTTVNASPLSYRGPLVLSFNNSVLHHTIYRGENRFFNTCKRRPT